MNKGWLELESDPGLFTLLLEDFGVKGVQVEEIYDLQKPFEGITYGFIFLFRWIEERRSRRKTITDDESFVTDEDIVNSIFFAQQMIPNSCATHSLLSVLLNCEKVNLGETLSDLKQYCKHMNPENKGHAIGNIPELARAHNSHARKEASRLPEKQQGISVRTMEAFHFVSYVPIHGRLFELDGLKPYPIDHGPWDDNEDWTQKFRHVISERLGMATGGEPYHDIRFNLMAVVPDKVSLYEQKLSTLKTNRTIVLEALQQMIKAGNSNITTADKEKCLAVVKKHAPEVAMTAIAMETEEATNEKEAVSDRTKVSVNAEVTKITDELESKTKVIKQVRIQTPTEMKEIKVIKTDNGAIVKVETESDSSTTPESKTDKVTTENVDLKVVKVKEDDRIPVAMEIETTAGTTDLSVPVSVPVSVPCSADLTKPLTIETKFTASPGPSSESTDTASEVGSCFSSPSSSTIGNSAQNSPNLSITDKALDGSCLKSEGEGSGRSRTKLHSQHGFRPKDLIALLKNVENEIKQCETKLQDEQEKIRKYKIDNCRRTHNYDQFLCMFLSMLAEQGHLADLVQQHSFIKKRVPGHIRKLSKLSQVVKKKKTKPKKRK